VALQRQSESWRGVTTGVGKVKNGVRRAEDSPVSLSTDRSYDAATTALLPAVGAALAVLLAAQAGISATSLNGQDRAPLLTAYGVAALLLGVTAAVLHSRPLPVHFANTVAVSMLAVPIGLGVTHLAVAGDPRQTTTVAVAVLTGGAVLLSLRWVLSLLYLAVSSWLVAAFLVGGHTDQWPHFALLLTVAAGGAVAISHLRQRAVRELSETKEAAEAAAVRDHLTGVANRRGLAMVGSQLVENARRQGDAVHCLFVDIDGMSAVNDTCGHAAGDEVIVAVADALREVTRATDVVARWSGDEFCVVGPGPGMPPLELERRVQETVLPHTPVAPEVWNCQVTAGGAMLAPWDAGSLETLLSHADQELHLRRTLRREAKPLPRRAAPTE
jgi:diguanylate cyclase (GGDEF)-like protein